MSNLAEYFAKNRYHPTWHIGDRVFGKWNKIPFVGTVGNDSLVNEVEGPRVSVHLDLPINIGTAFVNMIKVKHKDLIDIKGSYESNSKTNRKRSVVGSNRRSTKSR